MKQGIIDVAPGFDWRAQYKVGDTDTNFLLLTRYFYHIKIFNGFGKIIAKILL